MRYDQSVTANESDWGDACLAAALDDSNFLNFRSEKAFLRVIEGSPTAAGLYNLRRLLKNDRFRKCLPLLQMSDSIGNPQNLVEFKVDGINYRLSPTTIRYANNAINIMTIFGEEILKSGVICEIGGGYGGEACVFNHFSRTIFNASIGNRWKLYDLPTSHLLIRRFLKTFQYEVDIVEEMDSKWRPDLVISNGAISEMWGDTLKQYLDNIVSRAKRGYFMTNFETASAPFGGITTDKYIAILKGMGKTDALLLPARSFLSDFDHKAGTRLVVFGAGSFGRVLFNHPNKRDIVCIILLDKLFRMYELSVKKYL